MKLYLSLIRCCWGVKNMDKEYERICEKLGFIPSELKTDICIEDDNWVNPFSILLIEEQDYLYDNGYLTLGE